MKETFIKIRLARGYLSVRKISGILHAYGTRFCMYEQEKLQERFKWKGDAAMVRFRHQQAVF